MERLRLPAAANPIAVAQALSARPEVQAAQPNFIRQAVSVASPNDPYYLANYLWGFATIGLPDAWSSFGAGSDTVVVADIDTGVNYSHPDLAANMWINPGEVAGNGFDDDQNGYVDDVHGIDAVHNDSDPADDHGHGTHTAGTFGAVSDNGVGVAGVAPNVRILACKFITAQNTGTDADAIECFNYVVAMKQRGVNVRVTSNSWGGRRGRFFPSALKNAIDAAGAAGILNVFAAGNDGMNIDVTPYDPASFDSPSIVTVAASDSGDQRAGWSNYGAVAVDLAAPGVDTLSTYPGGYAYASGTSMATPHVAGVAALLLAHTPSLTVAETKDSLLNSVDRLAQWNGLVAAGGRLNAYGTLTTVPGTPVNAPPSVAITSPAGGTTLPSPATITITASASDNDGGVTAVSFYANGALVGTSTNAPYQTEWSATSAGTYALTAVATDTGNATTTSAAVTVHVSEAPPANTVPEVSLIAPADGSVVSAGAAVTIGATASDPDGIVRVEFYAGTTPIGSDTSADDGYSAQWQPTAQGWFTLTARAVDAYGNVGTSASIRVRVRRK